MKCLIIAAGQGNRLKTISDIKPLMPLLGVPLIERVIRTARQSGVDDFYVVTGYRAEKINAFLKQLATRLNISVTILHNSDWHKENGFSVLKAKHILTEPFLLMMADHLFDPAAVRSLQKQSISKDDVILAVDTNLKNPFVDMDDVTKVFIENNHILDIGKNIQEFNGFDTGLFLCTPGIFDALEHSCKTNQESSLSAAIRIMARRKQVTYFQFNGSWIDIDDEKACKKAEKMILTSVHGKKNDGPVSRWINRPLSIQLSKILVNYPIKPNQISIFSFLLSIIAAGLFAWGGWGFLAAGGLIAQVASVIDGSDGEVARLKYLSSDYGGWFDAVLDRYADAFLLFGLTWHIYQVDMSHWSLFCGFMAIIGSFMLSYTADKYDMLMKERIHRKGIRIGRDIRVFLIFLGAVFNQPFAVVVLIAVLMNAATLHRIIICRNEA